MPLIIANNRWLALNIAAMRRRSPSNDQGSTTIKDDAAANNVWSLQKEAAIKRWTMEPTSQAMNRDVHGRA